MENASKALIIAGAILLSILIISLGIVVVTNARATIDKANVNQTEAETSNSKIEAYVGSGKTPTEVKQCLSTIYSYNGTKTGTLPTITVNYCGSADYKKMPSDMKDGETFTISVETYKDGYIESVKITKP